MARASDPMGGGWSGEVGLDCNIQPRRTKMIKLDRTETPAAAEHATVYLAFELSQAKWKLGVLLPGSQKLMGQSVINHEIDPSSIEVNRRARRAKTDRIDLEKLMRTFLAYLRGEPRVCSMVHVPSVEDEDRKRRTRERERLLKERTAHTNRIKGLLHGQGIRDVNRLARTFIKDIARLRTGD